jgi:hypothetical protein
MIFATQAGTLRESRITPTRTVAADALATSVIITVPDQSTFNQRDP